MNNILAGYLAPHPPIIVEEIGKGEEKKAQATVEGMKKISDDIKSKSPSTIIVITPHGPVFSDGIAISAEEELSGSFKNFGFNDLSYKFKNNLELVEKILEKSSKEDIVTVRIDKMLSSVYNVDPELDHGALVPLHFIDKEYKDFKLVHITYGLLPPRDLYRFGKLIKDALVELDESAVVIASGDLSHKLSDDGPYSYSPAGPEFDEKIIEIIKDRELKHLVTFDLGLAEKAGECGLRSLMIMAGVLDRFNLDRTVLSYEGPFGVGYGTAIIDVVGENDKDILKEIDEEEKTRIEKTRDNESPYVKLARKSLEHYIETGSNLELKKESTIKNGVFVTLKKDGILRGCIGTIAPTTDSIEREIVQNAVTAGTSDSRFDIVSKDELDKIIYSVDVLYEPEAIKDIEDLDVEKYGVIVSSGSKKGLLLPNLDGIDRVEDQIEIALNKAGIGSDEEYSLERFKVVRHH